MVSFFDVCYLELMGSGIWCSIIDVGIRALRSKHPHCLAYHNMLNVLWLLAN